MLHTKLDRKNVGLLLIVISMILLLAACGGNNQTAANEEVQKPAATAPTAKADTQGAKEEGKVSITDLAGNTVEFDKAPERIVVFSTGDLETIYALGGTVVGRPVIDGDVPEAYKDVAEIGKANSVNVEKIASLRPDLVIAHKQLNAKDVPALKELGIKVLLTGAQSIDEVNATIDMAGKVLHKEAEAAALTAKIQGKAAEVKAGIKGELRSMIIFGVPGNWMIALPTSLSGSMLEAVGGYNIAKDYPKLEKFPQYAQLNIERIVEANPNVIFLITPGSEAAAKASFTKEMEKNPAWQSINAVKAGNFILLPNQLFGSNPGPKVMESLEFLQKEIEAVQAK